MGSGMLLAVLMEITDAWRWNDYAILWVINCASLSYFFMYTFLWCMPAFVDMFAVPPWVKIQVTPLLIVFILTSDITQVKLHRRPDRCALPALRCCPSCAPTPSSLGSRHAFSVVGPTVYNSLPADIRLCHSVDSFKRHLKTPLFRTP